MPTSNFGHDMKQLTDEIALFLTQLFSRSMSPGHYPPTFKEALITPVTKCQCSVISLNLESIGGV